MESDKKQIKYPYLPEGQKILYVPKDNKFMLRAKEVAHGSNEQQQPTGVVVVHNDKVVSEDSNINPLSNRRLIDLHQKYCIRHILKIPSGDKYWLCPGCAKKEDHAEHRAIKKLLKNKTTNGPFDLYLWGHWWCCDVCWDSMMKLPIRNVYLLENSEILFNLKNPRHIVGNGRQFDR
ncbi:MAG: hypothetical protein UW07_C0037G0008 [Candidatus Nomurabacteria bacterium GW2011_GWF2_43_8]|uniref:CMP/dCMP-type deaminase domain-containing protein n=3 Tax=Candidatus Nomuraibacteriota TaxID=1752729 RepID=A0A0G1FJ44_9BACT|nr:MAG: hypothetical protein UV76_C0002G0037 [Candidatus Nomurabacteria bacterium GW2011_GWA2_43_15]KKT19920.1 MAG: hypothetical protein UW02_C0004G0097 [Candidatus Nomurabacteria bacterium GW2011_GWB1_43_7]KKT22391.1 MAG: hypothetical protein UW07_C0037G0008 [Candidatus Nomurabacteria bacterium GW2011_GWF2_43_8]